ncbi:MAG: hypothetical protein KGJ41_10110 [Rhodospirillales bacterium]|nr:hypothetical protein [Rhodospirillales bacterium]MDE2199365.1 hypothetical protein [Rhodospirillales bacterium]MDE2574045.1 hypothetical protein [Rhodospirillales bacterium]
MIDRIILVAFLAGAPWLAAMAAPPAASAAAETVAPHPAADLKVDLRPATGNPDAPRMGDRLAFRSTIRNAGTTPVDGLIAWLSLVQVDPGHEQPVDLEDWSAHKAIAVAALAPGAEITTAWPMRLIQSGRYRVVVSAVSRTGAALTPSRFVDFTVQPKPVVESGRVLPVALGVPALLLGGVLLRRRRS